MPNIAFKSRIRTTTESCSLTMVVEHHLLIGEPSDPVLHLKHSPPGELDVFLASNFFITISGTLNAAEISSKEIQNSHITRHLVEYMRMANLESIQCHPAAIFPKTQDWSLASPRSLRSSVSVPKLPFAVVYIGCRPPSDVELRANLVGFNIRYVWLTKNKSTTGSLSEEEAHLNTAMNPFSPNLSLPHLTVVNNTVQRFMTFQVVKRYPLIFGHWCKQLDVEVAFFHSIYASIESIMDRSPNADFVGMCKKLLKVSEHRISNSRSTAHDAISEWIGALDTLNYPKGVYGSKYAFIAAMNQMYRLGMKQPQFKGLSVICNIQDKEDNLLELIEHDMNMDGVSEDYITQAESNCSERLFYALDLHDGHFPDEFNLFSDCDTDLEIQSELLHLGSEFCHFGPKNCDVWPSDFSSDLGDDEDLYDFAVEFVLQQSISEESSSERSPFQDASLCDWSHDTDTAQEKATRSCLGMTLSPDSPSFPKIDMGSLGGIPGLNTACHGPTLGEDYVDEGLFCDSPSAHIVGSELMDDHEVINFEDENASLFIPSRNEEQNDWSDSQPFEECFEENFEQLVALPDVCIVAMEYDCLREGSSSALSTNGVQGFLIMDFE